MHRRDTLPPSRVDDVIDAMEEAEAHTGKLAHRISGIAQVDMAEACKCPHREVEANRTPKIPSNAMKIGGTATPVAATSIMRAQIALNRGKDIPFWVSPSGPPPARPFAHA